MVFSREPEKVTDHHCYRNIFSVEVSLLVADISYYHFKRFASGNGLVSYYINLVLEGVGIMSPRTKAAINGGLQVSSPMTMSEIVLLTLSCSAGILPVR